MYLKSLELLGFKSFAPKTTLNFHRGVTAVVGPNGCGKSNVLDAIRWVLGEQSAKALRGGEMADVIFSGTDSRSALGMAEVSMTFAECEKELGLDWNEVTITRRVFRDGGSEYLLNKTPCRLRDIHGLFMDTGIGRSAYSIMEQGKIDLILSSRPEDRRAIFEEAAGITKFKSQKKEALRKLEATEANLLRLQDIVKEVKRQIGSLQRQAGKARRYQTLLSDLKTLETHNTKRQFDVMDEQASVIRGQLGSLTSRQAEAETEMERMESEVAVQRGRLHEMEEKLEAARRIVNDVRTRISNHENRLVFNAERMLEFTTLVDRYRSDVAAAEEKLRVAEAQLQQTVSEIEEITALLASELRHMEEKQAGVAALNSERQEADQAILSLASEQQRQEQKVAALRGHISNVAQQREGAEARLAILSGDLDGLATAFERIAQQMQETTDGVTRSTQALETANARLADGDTELREAQSTLAQADSEIRNVQRSLSERESKLEVLQAMVAGGEGFSQGTQAVLRGLDNPDFYNPAVLGALAQYIDVAPEFVPAVEAALGANMETIVMKDITIAEAVIRTLTSQKLGKSSLAPREFDSIFNHIETSSLTLPAGAIDWLINKITAKPEVKRLIERLVSHLVLAPDLETALRIFPETSYAVVTLAGEVVTGNGILYGGATKEAANSVLERKNQIVTLQTELTAIREQMQQLNEQRDAAISRIELAQLQLDEAREEKQNASLTLSEMRSQLSVLEREKGEAEKKSQNLEWERGNAEARHREAADKLGSLEEEVHAALAQVEEISNQRIDAAAALEIIRAQENEFISELNEMKVKVATERQRHTSLHHQREPMEARLAELNDLLVQRCADIESYGQRMETTEAENAEIESNLESLRVRIGESEEAVSTLVEERTDIAAAAEQAADELRVLRTQLSQCHDQRSKLEVRQSQLEMRITAISEHVQKRYQIDLRYFERDFFALEISLREALKRQRSGSGAESDENYQSTPVAIPEPYAQEQESPEAEVPARPEIDEEDIDWERIDALVRELDQKIDSMGPVNIDAIQEYDELEQRHTFLENQNNDLLNSKEELLNVLEKINTTTRQLFAETFEKIRVNFQEMFGELFGGGKADLILSDASDPLESGIEIIAKPPGKQLQTITLLSGGERTMTAVALLFSIYMVKPSPFCVLDEMDAPLDESNISRFIKILDRFVGQSQFVVISHHKRTIARADALYGVTMEEHGVSKLVGVKFARRDESQGSNDIMGSDNAAPIPSVAETFGKSGDLHSEQAQQTGVA